jgi:hypothetical protein
VARKRPRGRPRGDLALILRNQVWGTAVYERSGLSWDALDIKFLGEGPRGSRPRAFWWIARIGVNPRSARRKQSKIDLVSMVGEGAEFDGLKEAFESPLWDLLEPPQSDWMTRASASRTLLKRLSLFRANFPEIHDGASALPNHPAFQPWQADPTRWISHLLEKPSLDLIALLCLAFQEALSLLDLEEASYYLRGVRDGLPKALEHLHCPQKIALQLQRLVVNRLLRNDWSGVDADAVAAPRESRSKAYATPTTRARLTLNQLGEPMAALVATLPSYANAVRSSPIVPMSDALREFVERRGELAKNVDAELQQPSGFRSAQAAKSCS